MSTEVIGYLARPKAIQKPIQQTKRRIRDICLPDSWEQRLYGVVLMELGVLTIPYCDGDATAFVLMALLSIVMIGGKSR